ncbi:hypothetical protein Q5424_12795 [Conexibacter sp. JD483]|uniref:hypothetical protein n=1 Tax=unclassified Conexibacter TaxID=2627773 RepID=UPI0027171A83|nr:MULTISPECIES: hypothetical protein [unclassified Conexibacter]MDO8187306.1 hypothetical protein [Conexibacter sp. CPCC 205706]MDO8200561.1 hypothetical protein [Conexibacter sp. CPCC 205762]MDR9369970.1 hypothetical protein [Conexibacter sp. JD483]
MSRRLSAAVLALAGGGLIAALPAAAAQAARTALVGTFQIAPGRYAPAKGKRRAVVSGSYFRMTYPNGDPLVKGPFFENSDSRAKDKTYTLFTPGIDKGIRTGGWQPQPTPAFAPNGFALANRIVRPLPFAGIKFSLSTADVDKQSGAAIAVLPAIWANGRTLTGDLRSFTASWNSIYFNQGTPKPNGKLPGKTTPIRGTYDAKTRRYAITWSSQIVGGPFNDFTGRWHFEGVFKPGAAR